MELGNIMSRTRVDLVLCCSNYVQSFFKKIIYNSKFPMENFKININHEYEIKREKKIVRVN